MEEDIMAYELSTEVLANIINLGKEVGNAIADAKEEQVKVEIEVAVTKEFRKAILAQRKEREQTFSPEKVAEQKLSQFKKDFEEAKASGKSIEDCIPDAPRGADGKFI